MLYAMFQAQNDLFEPMRLWADGMAQRRALLPDMLQDSPEVRRWAAAWELVSRGALTHTSPAFGFTTVDIGKQTYAIEEEAAFDTPFGTLLHFKKDGFSEAQPKVLVVAPLSGHFATLLRGTVEVLLPENDVYITDWKNARDIPVAAGRFGFDEYVEHVMRFLEVMGAGSHLLGVCQPCAHALAAVAVMAEDDNKATPRSVTLMAGPVDTRINPSKVNNLAKEKPIEWFESNLISTVPWRYEGAGRRVYPGFVQLMAFMSMNAERHLKSHVELYEHLKNGETEKAQAIKTFYDEYFAVLDLTEEFYLETVSRVFQEHLLPQGMLEYRGRKVDPGAIRRTSLLTVEGERDDICSIGQTLAAHDLCRSIKPHRKRHHLQPGVGHYGVFSGGKWRRQIYPLVRNTILASA
ncbi:MAG: polyhydroxyalkanoate depolymerase [Caulobacterales bacterium]